MLVQELDQENSGAVNYKEFLKFSYLSQMFIYHFKLELMLREYDKQENTGMVKVSDLDQILHGNVFNFPMGAVD